MEWLSESFTFIFDISSHIISRQQSLYSKFCCSIMNNTKQSEILLKVIERIYELYPNMQSTVDFVLIDILREQNINSEKVFLLFAFYYNVLF